MSKMSKKVQVLGLTGVLVLTAFFSSFKAGALDRPYDSRLDPRFRGVVTEGKATITPTSTFTGNSGDTKSLQNQIRDLQSKIQALQGQVRPRRGTVRTGKEETGAAGPEYEPGVLVVKFRGETDPIRLLSGDKLRLFSSKYRPGAEPVSSGLYRQMKVTGKSELELTQAVKNRFSKRLARVPENIKDPRFRRVFKLKLASANQDIFKAIEELKQSGLVEYAEPNYIARIQTVPNDPYFSSSNSWGQGYDDLWGIKRIKADLAWDISTSSQSVVVAVVDTGIDYNHPDIQGNIWINSGEIAGNGVDDDLNGYIDDDKGYDFTTCESSYFFCIPPKSRDNSPFDDHGHGTHVGGTIGAVTNNGLGVAGIAWNSKLMAVKGLSRGGEGGDTDLADAIRYAVDNGTDIINMSWGGGGFSQLIADALDYAYSMGVVSVAAAGNDNRDISIPGFHFYPAILPHIVTVAALAHDETRSSFSNWGNLIDVIAPGGSSGDRCVVPAGQRYFVDVLSLRASGTDMYMGASCYDQIGEFIAGNNYYRARGTSMAAPHVSGVAALILSVVPTFNHDVVEYILQRTAEDVFSPGFDADSGYGLVDAYAALNLTRGFRDNPRPELAALGGSAILKPVGRLEFQAEVTNFGLTAATNVEYQISTEVGGGPVLLYRGTIASLLSGEKKTINQTLTLGNVSTTVLFELDPNNSVSEHFEDNNQLIIPVELPYLDGWPQAVAGGVYSSPAVKDLNNDGTKEIIVGENDNKVLAFRSNGSLLWSATTGGRMASSPAVADINRDGTLEIVVGSDDGKLYAFDASGNSLPAPWPVTLGGAIKSSPALADLDGGGTLEIVVGSLDGKVYALRPDGSFLPTPWPAVTGGEVRSSPAIADLDKDGSREVVVGSRDGKVYVFRSDGSLLTGWPQNLGNAVETSPAIGNLDQDSDLEIVVAAGGNLYAFNHDGTPLPAPWPWRSFNAFQASPVLADLDKDGRLEVIVGTAVSNGQLYVFRADGSLYWSRTVGPQYSSPAVGDFEQDGFLEIVVGNLDGNVYAFRGNGDLVAGWPVSAGGNLYSSPTLADLDSNGTLEVVQGTNSFFSNKISVWTLPWVALKNSPWPMFRHDIQRTGLYTFVGDYLCGDMNDDNILDVLDVVHLVDYAFRGVPIPPNVNADLNDDGFIDVLDVVLLVDHAFRGGLAPDCTADLPSAASASVSLGSGVTNTDGTISVPLNVNASAPLLGLQVGFSFDQNKLEFSGVEKNASIQNFEVQSKVGSGSGKVGIYDQEGETKISSGFTGVANLKFKPKVSGADASSVKVSSAISVDERILKVPTSFSTKTFPKSPPKLPTSPALSSSLIESIGLQLGEVTRQLQLLLRVIGP